MTIFIAIGVLLVVALVMFFMFRTKPKKPEKTIVAITPPSGGGIAETYIEFADPPTIEVTGLNVTLPDEYGKWTFNDGSEETAELTKMTLELRQGDKVLGQIEYTRDTADPPLANWYKAGQKDQTFTVVLTDDLKNYDSTLTSPLKAYVSFTNDPDFENTPAIRFTEITAPERYQTGTEDITGGGITGGAASYIGAPTNYTTLTDTAPASFLHSVALTPPENPTPEACKATCDEFPACKYISIPSDGSTCSFYTESLLLRSLPGWTIYQKQ